MLCELESKNEKIKKALLLIPPSAISFQTALWYLDILPDIPPYSTNLYFIQRKRIHKEKKKNIALFDSAECHDYPVPGSKYYTWSKYVNSIKYNFVFGNTTCVFSENKFLAGYDPIPGMEWNHCSCYCASLERAFSDMCMWIALSHTTAIYYKNKSGKRWNAQDISHIRLIDFIVHEYNIPLFLLVFVNISEFKTIASQFPSKGTFPTNPTKIYYSRTMTGYRHVINTFIKLCEIIQAAYGTDDNFKIGFCKPTFNDLLTDPKYFPTMLPPEEFFKTRPWEYYVDLLLKRTRENIFGKEE